MGNSARSFGLLGAAAALCILPFACSDSNAGGANPDGNFAGGSEPLVLGPAPPGLCDGDGTSRDCSDPGGCESSDGRGENVGAPPQGGGMDVDEPGYGEGGSSQGGGGGNGGSLGVDAGPVGGSGGSSGAAAGAAGAAGSGDCGNGDAGVDGGDAGDDCAGGTGGSGDVDGGTGGSVSQSPQATGTNACANVPRTAPATLYMSADDSGSMASPVIARRLIRRGRRVPASIIRPWEFLNYYDFGFEPAPPGEVRIVPQLSSCPTNGQLSFQVALQAEARPRDQRRPLNVTFVLDTSGSMSGEPIELQAASMHAIAGELREGDVVSMVTWNTDQRDVLTSHVVTGPDDPTLLSAIDALEAGGGTDLQGGLARGYELAELQYSPERINRVVVVSDGQANVGITNEEMIGRFADDEEGEEGIYLAGVGVGDGVNDTLMNVVTDVGRGAYVYIDSEQEAERMLGERFLQVVDLGARSVRLEVTLPWYLAIEKFYGEVVSTDASKVRPQHLAPNDAMLFFQVLQACDASLIHGDDRIRLRATWETPFGRQSKQATVETTLNALAGDDSQLTKAAAIAGYAEALSLASALSGAERAQVLQTALDHVLAAPRSDQDPDLVEVAQLLERYRDQ